MRWKDDAHRVLRRMCRGLEIPVRSSAGDLWSRVLVDLSLRSGYALILDACSPHASPTVLKYSYSDSGQCSKNLRRTLKHSHMWKILKILGINGLEINALSMHLPAKLPHANLSNASFSRSICASYSFFLSVNSLINFFLPNAISAANLPASFFPFDVPYPSCKSCFP